MWELTLVGNSEDLAHFRLLCDTLHSSYAGVWCAVASSNQVYCSIATSRDDIVPELWHIIAGIMIKIVKVEYFNNHLKLFKNNPLFHEFAVNSIALADIDDEIKFVLANYELSGRIFIRSFVNFKLQVLVRVWHRICGYISENFSKSIESEWCLDFLKFVASSVTVTDNILTIDRVGEKIKIHNIFNGKDKYYDIENEYNVIIYLILCAPKKVIIEGDSQISDRLSLLISYIFDDKVCNII